MAATWNELPESVRVAVQQHIGPVTRAEQVTGGQNSDVAAVLYRDGRPPVFLKGVEGVSRRMRFLRNESTAAPLAPGVAPAVLFAADVNNWLVVGFDYIAGRPADFSPGSADLDVVADAVERIAALPAPGVRSMRDRWSVDWWGRLAAEGSPAVAGWDVQRARQVAASAPERATGDRLAHTDLHPDQLIITPTGAVAVIDWGFPAAAAPWVDAALLILRLIDAGHPPDSAEAWAFGLSCFSGVEADAVTAFAVYLAGMWTQWADHDPVPGKLNRAALARDYAAWRLP